MLEALRRRLTYANVMATVAVFIALGGSGYAALRITGKNVVNGSLTGKKLKRDSLGAREVREWSLGKVRRAHDSDRLGGLRASQLRVHCPDGMMPIVGVCMETTPRPALSYGLAASTCNATGQSRRRLPSHQELDQAVQSGIVLTPGGELTSEVYPSSSNPGRVDALVVTGLGTVTTTPDTGAGAKPYRCILYPAN